MKIEAGKRYVRRDGVTTDPLILRPKSGFLSDPSSTVTYGRNGIMIDSCNTDFEIVAEYWDRNKPIRTKNEKEPCTYIGSTSDGRIIVEFTQYYDKDKGVAIAVLKHYEVENVPPEPAKVKMHVRIVKNPDGQLSVFLSQTPVGKGDIVAENILLNELEKNDGK